MLGVCNRASSRRANYLWTLRDSFLLTTIFLVFLADTIRANNHHEHLENAPRAEDFLPSAERYWDSVGINNIYSPSQRPYSDADRMRSETNRNLVFHLVRIFEKEFQGLPDAERRLEDKINSILSRMKDNSTLHDLATQISPADPKQGLKLLLEFPTAADGSPIGDRKLYIAIERTRREIFKVVKPDVMADIFGRFFASESKTNGGVLHVTASDNYFRGQMGSGLKRVIGEARKNGIEMKIFASIGRQTIFDSKDSLWESRLRDMEVLLSKNDSGIRGIDLTGSMLENTGGHVPPGVTVGQTEARLRQLFDLAVKKNVELRLHAFEASNQGLFYEALNNVLATYDRPIRLRIGHIAAMHPSDVARLGAFRRRLQQKFPTADVIADVNWKSNRILQGTPRERLRRNIIALQNEGIPTVSGADGRGIIGPESTYTHQQTELDAFQDQYSHSTLINLDTLHSTGRMNCELSWAEAS